MAARLDNGYVRLLTRTGLDWTTKYPAIAEAIAELPASTSPIAVNHGARFGGASASGPRVALKSTRSPRTNGRVAPVLSRT